MMPEHKDQIWKMKYFHNYITMNIITLLVLYKIIPGIPSLAIKDIV